MIFIIMGVSGSGKTTVGKMLAERRSCVFYDSDRFHSKENIEKMSRGAPLSDSDREPWLWAIRNLIEEHSGPMVIACSALKKSYRDFLDVPDKNINFIYLTGDLNLIKKRLVNRKGHFAGADLLHSQFLTLQEPDHALTLDIVDTPEVIVEKILSEYGLGQRPG